jgi:scavenger receptor class B, member 1
LSGEYLSEDDVITVPNIPLISGIPNVKLLGVLAEFGYEKILAATKPKEFQRLSIAQYFLGYTDDFMNLISKIKWDFDPEDVGILAPRRGVSKQNVTVFSGTDDVSEVGKVFAVDKKTKLDIWTTEACNHITGSDGVIYGPFLVQNKEDLAVYLPAICRSLPLVFDKEVKIENGMRSFRYKQPFGTFSSPESYPDNKFYCEPKGTKDKPIDGVLDVSKCIDGNPPILISYPHFMEGDQQLLQHFDGLNPNESLHSSFAYIHPRLSVPFFGVSRMQLNIKVNRFGKYFEKIPDEIILPLVWIEMTTEDFSESLKTKMFLSTIVVDNIELFFKFGSLISLMISLFVLVLRNS